jgi:hypothetical protein
MTDNTDSRQKNDRVASQREQSDERTKPLIDDRRKLNAHTTMTIKRARSVALRPEYQVNGTGVRRPRGRQSAAIATILGRSLLLK